MQLLFAPLFPREFRPLGLGHRAILGLGGNIGDVKRRFAKVVKILKNHPRVHLLATSAILKNPPFGYLNQPDFFNAVIEIETNLSPKELLQFCFWLERRFKRERTFKNAPRTLDVDIIFYDDRTIKKDALFIPHPHWHKRDSVIIPLLFLGSRR